MIELSFFLDKSELNKDGLYDYYYKGYIFTIKGNDFAITGKKYDYNKYVSFLGSELLTILKKHIKEIKFIINDILKVGRIVFIHTGDIYYYWNYDIEDEQNWRLGLRNGKGNLFYHDDTLWYEGDFLEAKFHGMGNLYDRDGNLIFSGQFIEGNPVK
jgi:hypothetical protein